MHNVVHNNTQLCRDAFCLFPSQGKTGKFISLAVRRICVIVLVGAVH